MFKIALTPRIGLFNVDKKATHMVTWLAWFLCPPGSQLCPAHIKGKPRISWFISLSSSSRRILWYFIAMTWLGGYLGYTGIPHFGQAKSCSNFDHPLANTSVVVAKQLFSFFVHRCTQIGPRKHRAFGVHREEHIGQLRDKLKHALWQLPKIDRTSRLSRRLEIMREPCCNQNHPGNTLLSVWDPEQFTTHNNPQGLKVVAEKICETQLLKKIWILDCQLPTLALNKHPGRIHNIVSIATDKPTYLPGPTQTGHTLNLHPSEVSG